jgi:hypothetical protein
MNIYKPHQPILYRRYSEHVSEDDTKWKKGHYLITLLMPLRKNGAYIVILDEDFNALRARPCCIKPVPTVTAEFKNNVLAELAALKGLIEGIQE